MFVKGNMKWQSQYSVSGLGQVSSFSVVNTFTPSPGSASLCGPPCNGQDGVRPQNRSWRRPQCQNHSDFTTHGTCEHDTGARWKTACRTNSVTPRPSEMNVLAPHRLILLIHPLTRARFRFPSSQTHFVTDEPSGSKPNKFTMLHFLTVFSLWIGPLTMCAFDRDIRSERQHER